MRLRPQSASIRRGYRPSRSDFHAHWRSALGPVPWAHARNVEQGARRQPPPVLRDTDEHDRYAATTCCKAVTAGVATPTMTSGSSASNSRAYARKLSGRPAAHRVSIRTLRPGTQPNLSSTCKSAAMRACPSASLAAKFMSTPIRRIRSACCARAVTGRHRPAESLDKVPPPHATPPELRGWDRVSDVSSQR